MAGLQIVIGLVLLVIGGDALVRGAVGAARRLRVSPLVTGLVLVGFGTSTPELVTSVNAVLKDSAGIAVGNVVGSNIANILLILGLAAVITPLRAEPKAFWRDGPMLGLATLIGCGVMLYGAYNTFIGAVFLVLLASYIVFTYVKERQSFDAQAALHVNEAELATPGPGSLWLSLLMAGAGIALVILGADWMVAGSITIARLLNIPETIIGLTIVAVGTSLPELVTSVVAAVRKESDIAFGNIVGSNIFNILGILGVTALIKPFAVPQNRLTYDAWIMLAVTALLLLLALARGRLSRIEGGFFLLLYGAYLAFLTVRATAAV